MKAIRWVLVGMLAAALSAVALADSKFEVLVDGKKVAERTSQFAPEITGELILRLTETRTENGVEVKETERWVLDRAGSLMRATKKIVTGKMEETLELEVNLGAAKVERKAATRMMATWNLQAPMGELIGLPHLRWFTSSVPAVGTQAKAVVPLPDFRGLSVDTVEYRGKRTIQVMGKPVEAHVVHFVESFRDEFYDAEGQFLGARGEDELGRPLEIRKIG